MSLLRMTSDIGANATNWGFVRFAAVGRLEMLHNFANVGFREAAPQRRLSRPMAALGQKARNLKVNLSKINDISIPAAVVLAAELDRWRRVDGVSLRPLKMDNWSSRMKKAMVDLGIFELLEVKANPIVDAGLDPSLTLVKLKSDTRADGSDVKELFTKLKYMTDRFTSKPYL
ncbi:MAG: hypothetical protein ACI9TA_003158, partial [Reinekea sp.]